MGSNTDIDSQALIIQSGPTRRRAIKRETKLSTIVGFPLLQNIYAVT